MKFFTALRALVVPAWAPYVLAVAMAFGTYWYIDNAARVNERALVESETNAAKLEAKVTAEKHFAERARANAAALAALEKAHAEEIAAINASEDQLTAALELEKAKNKDGKSNACWSLEIVKELRK